MLQREKKTGGRPGVGEEEKHTSVGGGRPESSVIDNCSYIGLQAEGVAQIKDVYHHAWI